MEWQGLGEVWQVQLQSRTHSFTQHAVVSLCRGLILGYQMVVGCSNLL
jgi:hypothetical protein